MRLCLIEDDYLLGGSIRDAFRSRGFEVDWVRDGESAEAAIAANRYWAVVLDLGLPRRSGFDVLTGLRARRDDTPVVIVSARDSAHERISCLDAGADDFLTKPCEFDELAARIRAVRRRHEGRASPVVRFGHISMDPSSSEVAYRGRAVMLPSRELALLTALIAKPGKILSRTQLIERVYGWDTEIESNAIEFHVHTLRKKLSRSAIRNIRGVGYALVDEAYDQD